MAAGTTVLGVAVLYILVLVVIGEYARRRTLASREDYFMASRGFRSTALFFSVVATVLSAFGIIGFPGQVYRTGAANFGLIVTGAILLTPVLMATVGYRFWLAGKEFGHITPAQFIDHRYETSRLGLLVMTLMVFWTIPYLVLGTIGGGIAFEAMTGGLIPFAAGAAIVVGIVFLYVLGGGMRGTTWTNVFQGGVMLVMMAGLMLYVATRAGGPAAASAQAVAQSADLAARPLSGKFTTPAWFSAALLLSLATMMFPHVFLRILTGASRDVYRRLVVLFPLGLLFIMVPATLLGFWGAGIIPGLTGAGADQIVPLLASQGAPALIAGLGLVLVLAAAMSSFDAQALTVTTLLSEDVLRPWTRIDERSEVRYARLGLAALLAIVYLVALQRPGTIFYLAEFAFQGYALIFYPVAIGMYWARATGTAVAAGLLTGFAGLWLFQAGIVPAALAFGFMPFVPVLAVQVLVVHAVSAVTDAPSRDRTMAYFGLFGDAW